MPTPLRDFLEIPYDQLEEMNLEAKAERLARKRPGQDPRAAPEVPDRREADQGGHGLLHRPRRPLPHARLRQEVPAQVGRQPDLRRLLDPRLLAAGRVRPAPGDRLAGLLLAAGRRLRPRQGAGLRRGAGARRHALPRPTCAARLKAYTDEALRRRTARSANVVERDRGLPVPGPRRRAPLPRDRRASSSSPPAATTTRCPATRCGSSSTAPPRCSARWASRTRRTTPRWRRRSSR